MNLTTKILIFSLLLSVLYTPISVKAGILSRPPTNLGLVGYWPMDEGVGNKVIDASGQNNTGTITGATWTNGKHGKALNFDGSSNYVNINNPGNFLDGKYLTISAWIYPVQSANSYPRIVDRTYNSQFAFYVADVGGHHELTWAVCTTGGCVDHALSAPAYNITFNKWQFVVLTWDGINVRTYINNVLIETYGTGLSGGLSNSTSDIRIGQRVDAGSSRDFKGQIDDVRIYNRALTAGEISKLYSSGGVRVNTSQNNQQGALPIDENFPANAAVGLVRQDCTGYSYCATSLSAWQTMMLGGSGPIDWTGCTAGDLVCKNKIAIAKIDGPWSGADTTSTSIGGWTTGVNNYIKIYTTAAARHDGKRSLTKYRLIGSSAWNFGLSISEDYVRVDGLQISSTGYGSNCFGVGSTFGTSVTISNTLIYDCQAPQGGTGIYINYGTVVLNNVAVMNNSNVGVYVSASGSVDLRAYNVTSINNGAQGFYVRDWRSLTCKNCYAGGNTGADYLKQSSNANLYLTTSYSEDGTEGTPIIPFSTTAGTGFKNITPGSEDLHISSMSQLKDKGTNLSTDLYWLNPNGNTDIDRQVRGGGNPQWDIGADEYSGTTKINSSQNNKLTNGLVGMWSFNGADVNWASSIAYDRSGNGNNGTISGTTATMGKLGQALKFNGAGNYVITPSLGTAPNSITLSVWIKPDPAGGTVMAELGQGIVNYGWHDSQIEVETDKSIKVCMWTAGLTCVVAATNITYGNWYHVVMVYSVSGTRLSSYVNGVAGGTTVATKQNPPSGLFYGIGSAESTNAGNANSFSGAIDEVRIYNRALSADEVKQLYRMGQ